ncbi:arylesterase [Gilvimarinus agarilyticus]|uniref:arylesterase n=1 Tax=Gilvimarinus sp. 2_MG-2023 TaxID=3062666 RepID=UPI001C08B7ED|nr:arylesterase [Gilvimarinus sp. 2_MG-2023]MBU2886467.1 arylesterase [Gilvimarinus agarilyticus]MDO6571146.1 arylesterase [Gilvimarinus sp. 2_MG-2023]
MSLSILRSAVLCLCFLLVACSDSPPLAPLPQGATILAFGDSLTRGTGAPPEQSYPAHLARLTGFEVINAGVPGEVSAEGLARLPEVLQQAQPDLIVLCHGGNDILRSLDKATMLNNLQAMIDIARDSHTPVVLVAVPKRSLLLRAEPVYQQLADTNSLPLQASVVADVLGDSELRSDRVHPNGAGYQIIAEAVYQLLQDSGAI